MKCLELYRSILGIRGTFKLASIFMLQHAFNTDNALQEISQIAVSNSDRYDETNLKIHGECKDKDKHDRKDKIKCRCYIHGRYIPRYSFFFCFSQEAESDGFVPNSSKEVSVLYRICLLHTHTHTQNAPIKRTHLPYMDNKYKYKHK